MTTLEKMGRLIDAGWYVKRDVKKPGYQIFSGYDMRECKASGTDLDDVVASAYCKLLRRKYCISQQLVLLRPHIGRNERFDTTAAGTIVELFDIAEDNSARPYKVWDRKTGDIWFYSEEELDKETHPYRAAKLTFDYVEQVAEKCGLVLTKKVIRSEGETYRYEVGTDAMQAVCKDLNEVWTEIFHWNHKE